MSEGGPEFWRRKIIEWARGREPEELAHAIGELLDTLLSKGLIKEDYYEYVTERVASIMSEYRLGRLSKEGARDQLLGLLMELVEVQAGLRKPRIPRPARKPSPPPTAVTAPSAGQEVFPSIEKLREIVREELQRMARALAEELVSAMAMLPEVARARALMPRPRDFRTAAALVGYRFAGHLFPEEVWLETRSAYDPIQKKNLIVMSFDSDTEYTLRSLFPIDATYFDLGCYIAGCYGWLPLDAYAERDLSKGLVPREYKPWLEWIIKIIKWIREHMDEARKALAGGERLVWRYPGTEPVHTPASG